MRTHVWVNFGVGVFELIFHVVIWYFVDGWIEFRQGVRLTNRESENDIRFKKYTHRTRGNCPVNVKKFTKKTAVIMEENKLTDFAICPDPNLINNNNAGVVVKRTAALIYTDKPFTLKCCARLGDISIILVVLPLLFGGVLSTIWCMCMSQKTYSGIIDGVVANALIVNSIGFVTLLYYVTNVARVYCHDGLSSVEANSLIKDEMYAASEVIFLSFKHREKLAEVLSIVTKKEEHI